MAMNKKEQAAFEALQTELREAKAMRFTDPVSHDLAPPTSRAPDTSGWTFNSYSGTVAQAWSSSIYHGYGPARTKNGSASQNPISLYSTKRLALRALRHSVEKECAAKLARIDRLIDEEGGQHADR